MYPCILHHFQVLAGSRLQAHRLECELEIKQGAHGEFLYRASGTNSCKGSKGVSCLLPTHSNQKLFGFHNYVHIRF